MELSYTINESNKYYNVKEVLKEEFQISNRLLLRLKNNKKIYLNGNITSVNNNVAISDVVSVLIDFEEENSNIVPTQIPLDILYEDEYFIIINKPAKLPVHPSVLHYENSLSNGLRYYFDTKGLKKKIRPVNRLDKDTSGIVVFAKNEYIQECFIKQMQSKQFIKKYIAICEGVFENQNGTINAPIARKPNSIIERCINKDGDIAITHYSVLEVKDNMSVLLCELETGRTHQIRLHLKHVGHPIIGDTLYGNSSPLINRQALHAYSIQFIHPITKKIVCYTSKLPEDMEKLLPNLTKELKLPKSGNFGN